MDIQFKWNWNVSKLVKALVILKYHQNHVWHNIRVYSLFKRTKHDISFGGIAQLRCRLFAEYSNEDDERRWKKKKRNWLKTRSIDSIQLKHHIKSTDKQYKRVNYYMAKPCDQRIKSLWSLNDDFIKLLVLFIFFIVVIADTVYVLTGFDKAFLKIASCFSRCNFQ